MTGAYDDGTHGIPPAQIVTGDPDLELIARRVSSGYELALAHGHWIPVELGSACEDLLAFLTNRDAARDTAHVPPTE